MTRDERERLRARFEHALTMSFDFNGICEEDVRALLDEVDRLRDVVELARQYARLTDPNGPSDELERLRLLDRIEEALR